MELTTIPAIELNKNLLDHSLYEFLKSQNVYLPRDKSYYGLGIALGGAEISLAEITRLYASLARRESLDKIQFFKTKPFETLPSSSWALSPESAWMTLNMLSKNPRAQSFRYSRWSRSQFEIAWKTGTSSGFRDAWTLGVFGPYTLGVWVGNFSGEPNPSFLGREAAAPLFFEIAEGLQQIRPFDSSQYWNSPDPNLEIKEVDVCSLSGAFPENHCPHTKKTWIHAGRSPIATCHIHQNILINNQTGLRSCPQNEIDAHYSLQTFEIWPTDLLEAFRSFGIHKKPLPRFEATCQTEITRKIGHAPEILSPRETLSYALRISNLEQNNQIAFLASADSDSQKLHWFVGKEHVGQSHPQETFLWKAKHGRHLISVVDDMGRSQSRWIDVKFVP